MEEVIKNYLDNVDKVEEGLSRKKELLNKFDNISDLFNFLYVGNLTKDLSLSRIIGENTSTSISG